MEDIVDMAPARASDPAGAMIGQAESRSQRASSTLVLAAAERLPAPFVRTERPAAFSAVSPGPVTVGNGASPLLKTCAKSLIG